MNAAIAAISFALRSSLGMISFDAGVLPIDGSTKNLAR